MTGLVEQFQHFHFIRPWVLLLVPIALAVWWHARTRESAGQPMPAGLAPHLAAALTIGARRSIRILPVDLVMTVIVLASLGAAGPSWTRVPNPLVAETAPLAIALKVSESMLEPDVPPSQLERAKHKILDLLADRVGGRTALIAYAGTAHRVTPLTEDPAILKPFLEGLSPQVMPQPGQNATAALELATAAIAKEPVPGAILFVLDDLDPVDLAAFERHTERGGVPLVFLSVSKQETAPVGLRGIAGASVVHATPDQSDVSEVTRRIASAYSDAISRDERQQWQDRGWMLAWPAALLFMLWFRRGWTMRWSFILAVILQASPGDPAKAADIADWFLTPDQQGQLAFERKQFDEAAEHFRDPMWKGYALYRAGKYAEAAPIFARLESAAAAFAQGMAHVRNRAYRDGITAFETALKRDPNHSAAARNLEITRAILAYVTTAREQSDTGEESGIGADEVAFDNESGRGTETTVTGEGGAQMVTAEQWMRTVDTRTSDFLRIRFALEAARMER